MDQEFEISVSGVQPKSLNAMNTIGQLLYLDKTNVLTHYDMIRKKQI